MINKFKYIFLICICVVAFASGIFAQQKKVPRYIRYSFTLRNVTGKVIPCAELWCFAPVSTSTYQRCVSISSSHKFIRETDDFGNQMLHFSFSNMPPYAVKKISVNATVELFKQPRFAVPINPQDYVGIGRYTDYTAPEIKSIPKFYGNTLSQKVVKIKKWIASNIKHGYFQVKPQGTVKTLKTKKGDCTEFMFLAVALCRREGIPARAISGFVCPRNMILMPTGLHDWFVWFDGKKWNTEDPYKSDLNINPENYIAVKLHNKSYSNVNLYHCRGKGVTAVMNIPINKNGAGKNGRLKCPCRNK